MRKAAGLAALLLACPVLGRARTVRNVTNSASGGLVAPKQAALDDAGEAVFVVSRRT